MKLLRALFTFILKVNKKMLQHYAAKAMFLYIFDVTKTAYTNEI